MVRAVQTEQDIHDLLAESNGQPVFLHKHSTRCPISAAAHRQYTQFAEEHPEIACWQVLVIEQRQLSQEIATLTGIPHQSPQAILFVNGKGVWHVTHYAITRNALLDAYEQFRGKDTSG